MGKIIDENEVQEMGTPEIFQFRDVRAMAAKILRRATEVAQQKIDAATRHVAELEQQAERKGHDDGYAKGLAKGEAEGRAAGEAAARQEFVGKVQGLAEVLAAIALGLDERKQELQARSEADLLRLSMAIARRIVRQELATDSRQVMQTVQAAISLATSRQDVMLCICPHDLTVIEEELPKLRQVFTDLGRVSVESRDNLQQGDVILVTHEGEIDLRLEEQFSAIERALAGSPMPPAEPTMQLRSHGDPIGVLPDPIVPASSENVAETPAVPSVQATPASQPAGTPVPSVGSNDAVPPSQNGDPQATGENVGGQGQLAEPSTPSTDDAASALNPSTMMMPQSAPISIPPRNKPKGGMRARRPGSGPSGA